MRCSESTVANEPITDQCEGAERAPHGGMVQEFRMRCPVRLQN